jgi:hypothetical protein
MVYRRRSGGHRRARGRKPALKSHKKRTRMLPHLSPNPIGPVVRVHLNLFQKRGDVSPIQSAQV